MSLFNLFGRDDINKEIENIKGTPESILLDVRSKDEFISGHIPGAINIPLNNISDVVRVIPDHNTPVCIYCLRGTRSRSAVSAMKELGYINVKSIGGIASYRGEIEM